jgi:hypothetical protein
MKPTTLLSLLPVTSLAHVMMKDPPPRRSKYSVYYRQSNNVDYNLVAPINAGYSFPCKGFPPGPSTKTVGKNVQITLEGSAIHGGGHCQFGISYDNANFVVLKTVPKNCLLNSMSYDFDLPDNVLNTKTIVFWTWINAIGNREYYMDCADVNINTNAPSNSPSPVSGNELFVANLPGFPTIPEFPRPDMYDGSDLLLSRQRTLITTPPSASLITPPSAPPSAPSITPPSAPPYAPSITPPSAPPSAPSITPPSAPPSAPLITPPSAPPTSQPPSAPLITPPSAPPTSQPPSTLLRCQTGDMKCGANGGFDTCVHDKWIWRACAPRTACKKVGETVICDFA